MTWKNVIGAKERTAAQYMLPEKAMNIGEEEEDDVWIVPKEIPQKAPKEQPAQQPVQVPEKVPQKVGAWKSVTSDDANPDEAPEGAKTEEDKAIGYRYATAAKRDGQWMLHSPMRPMPWGRGHVTATCDNGGEGHVAPHKGCHCGLYAKWEEPEAVAMSGAHEWITQVQAWGKMRRGTQGFRSQHQQISGIRIPKCEQCDETATHLISSGKDTLSGRPTCQEHKPDSISGGQIKVQAEPIENVAKELSNFYGGAKVVRDDEKFDSQDEDMGSFERDFGRGSGGGGLGEAYGSKWARVGWIDAKK